MMSALLGSVASSALGAGGGDPGGPGEPELTVQSGLVAWLDVGEVTATDGDPVDTIPDKTGNGHNATGSGSTRGTYKENSGWVTPKPALTIPNAATRMEIAASVALDNAEYTYVFVHRVTDRGGMTGDMWLFNKVNTNPATIGLRINSSAGYQTLARFDGSEGTTRIVDSGTMFPSETIRTHVTRYDGATLEHIVAGQGADGVYDSLAFSGAADTDNSGKLSLFNHPTVDNTDHRPHEFYELLIYNRALSDVELQSVYEYLDAKYAFRWLKEAVITTGPIAVSTHIDGTTAHMATLDSDGVTVQHWTAPTSDPHNWTLQGSIFTTPGACRGVCLREHGGSWYLYYDDRTSGGIRLAKGATIGALADVAGNPVVANGAGLEDYVRHGFVLTPAETHDGNWHMLYDGRSGSPTSGTGALFHATSTDGETWTKDSANNPVLSASGTDDWEDADVGDAAAYWDGADYVVIWTGYNSQWIGQFPHHFGEGISSDLSSITRVEPNPILPLNVFGAGFDQVSQTSPSPYRVGGATHLYYAGHIDNSDGNNPDVAIGYATRQT